MDSTRNAYHGYELKTGPRTGGLTNLSFIIICLADLDFVISNRKDNIKLMNQETIV